MRGLPAGFAAEGRLDPVGQHPHRVGLVQAVEAQGIAAPGSQGSITLGRLDAEDQPVAAPLLAEAGQAGMALPVSLGLAVVLVQLENVVGAREDAHFQGSTSLSRGYLKRYNRPGPRQDGSLVQAAVEGLPAAAGKVLAAEETE